MKTFLKQKNNGTWAIIQADLQSTGSYNYYSFCADVTHKCGGFSLNNVTAMATGYKSKSYAKKKLLEIICEPSEFINEVDLRTNK